MQFAKQAGCQNILALRGDPPHGQSNWTPPPGGFSKAIDLVKYIRAEYGDYFDIAVAGFPQGHPETAPGEDAQAKEIEYLKEKVDAGANFIFTQMFYDVDIFINWVRRVRAAGIDVPIVPGIMPIQSWQKFMTWVKRESIVVPQKFWDVLLPVQEDDERVRAIGTKLVADMCREILASDVGIRGLHVYTLNLEKGARMLLEELGLEGRKEQIQPLPWRPSLTPARRQESIRPIFWANRQQSYLSRTDDWDEFPNGRWGDSRSPAYGDLDGYPVKIDIPAAEANGIWGQPQTFEDIKALFARFCLHDLKALPWSTQPPSKETSVIDQQLAKMNRLGYLTINSQPAVDGAPSTDATHGWGPAGGYVYQKVSNRLPESGSNAEFALSRHTSSSSSRLSSWTSSSSESNGTLESRITLLTDKAICVPTRTAKDPTLSPGVSSPARRLFSRRSWKPFPSSHGRTKLSSSVFNGPVSTRKGQSRES